MRHAAAWAAASILCASTTPAAAQTVADLQRQIDELKAELQAMRAARSTETAAVPPPAAAPGATQTRSAEAAPAGTPAAPPPVVVADAKPHKKAWYEKLTLRGYTQMRYNGFLDGDEDAPAGRARLRSVHDGYLGDRDNFSLRRARLILQGNVTDSVSIYFQTDFASAVSGQSNGERREHYGQLRDAYVDVAIDKAHAFKLRFGQSKVPFGWENMQSSSNRLTLDRSDGINSAVPSERDLGVIAYYTPAHVQAIWDRLGKQGQKLFGNYGAFGAGIFNGQGVNRAEQNKDLTKVLFATWPVELDALGGAFAGQVFEAGGGAMIGRIRPEVRSGGVSAIAYDEKRIGVHAMLYPQPIGFQAEWNWGKGPEYDPLTRTIDRKPLNGGYVQAMAMVPDFGVGRMIPYARWQRYRGGWKAGTNAPRLATNETEVGVEWHFRDSLELTVAYANMKRREADERREGRAKGNLIRTQLQWSY